MTEIPIGHTSTSWNLPLGMNYIPESHTSFSWGFDKFRHRYGKLVNEMDEKHFDLYLCGEFSSFMDTEREVSHWVCPWQPTPTSSINNLIPFVQLSQKDVLVDAGCGDGRVLIEASLAVGCHGVGIDISPECIDCAKEISNQEGVLDRLSLLCLDFDQAIPHCIRANATILYMYLVPIALERARNMAMQLSKHGVKIVTHEYHYKDWPIAKRDYDSDLVLYEIQN